MGAETWGELLEQIAQGMADETTAKAIRAKLDRLGVMCNGANAALGMRDMLHAQIWVARLREALRYDSVMESPRAEAEEVCPPETRP